MIMSNEKKKFINYNMYSSVAIIFFLQLTGFLKLTWVTYFCYVLIYFYNNTLLDLQTAEESQSLPISGNDIPGIMQ